MPRFAPLLPVTAADLEINFDQLTRKRKLHSNSTSSSTTSSSAMTQDENIRPLDDYLAKKRTMPKQFCPKRRLPTQQAPAPVSTTTRPIPKEEDDGKLKSFLDARPHFRVERLPEATESQDMVVLKAFRRRDFLAAQAAKATGGFKEEPPMKKKKRVPKPFWQRN